jgi:hypothetical protein
MRGVRFTILMSVGLVLEVSLIVGLVGSSAAKSSQEIGVPTHIELLDQQLASTADTHPAPANGNPIVTDFGELRCRLSRTPGRPTPTRASR